LNNSKDHNKIGHRDLNFQACELGKRYEICSGIEKDDIYWMNVYFDQFKRIGEHPYAPKLEMEVVPKLTRAMIMTEPM
jgi:hypothetical protein